MSYQVVAEKIIASRVKCACAVFGIALTMSMPARAQQTCPVNADGTRPWCAGDVFVGIGTTVWTNPSKPTLQDPGTYVQLDPQGTPLNKSLVDAVAAGRVSGVQSSATVGCAQDPTTDDLFTTGLYTNVVSRFHANTGVLYTPGFIDATAQTRIACKADKRAGTTDPQFKGATVDPDDPMVKCGAVESVIFDKKGNFYLGTNDGTNRIIKYSNAGQVQASYTVPTGARGTDEIDLAADQNTMFYTSEDNTIRVFRLDGSKLDDLYARGVEPITDSPLDPNGSGHRFGKIVIKLTPGDPTPAANPAYALRVLPPGDGSGGLLVAVDAGAYWIGLDGYMRRGYNDLPDVSGFFAMDVAPDGRSFWTATLTYDPTAAPSILTKYHIPTGRRLVEPQTMSAINGLCVVHEYTAGARQPDCSLDPANPLCQAPVNCLESPNDAQCVAPVDPVLPAVADQDNYEGETIQPISIAATSPMGHALTYTVSGLPYGLSFDPSTKMIAGTLAYNAADTMPFATVAITVTDATNASARDTASFRWTVRDRNAPPVASARPGFALTTTPGIALANVALDATDMDSCDHLTMALRPGDVLPAGVTFSYRDTYPTGAADTCPRSRVFTGAFSGTPTTLGTTSFTIVVSDGKVQVPYAFTWTVGKVVAENRAPVCSTAAATPALLWPPNHKFTPIAIGGVTDPDGDAVTLKITRILQDEPTLAFGDEDDDGAYGSGYTPIDGMGVGTAAAQVRAERSGRGDGRIYEIGFTASDARGLSCAGTVKVGVPHDQGSKGGPVDSGVRYDSTTISWLPISTSVKGSSDSSAHTHRDGDGCDHDRHRNGHHTGDGCEHDRSSRR